MAPFIGKRKAAAPLWNKINNSNNAKRKKHGKNAPFKRGGRATDADVLVIDSIIDLIDNPNHPTFKSMVEHLAQGYMPPHRVSKPFSKIHEYLMKKLLSRVQGIGVVRIKSFEDALWAALERQYLKKLVLEGNNAGRLLETMENLRAAMADATAFLQDPRPHFISFDDEDTPFMDMKMRSSDSPYPSMEFDVPTQPVRRQKLIPRSRKIGRGLFERVEIPLANRISHSPLYA